MAKVTTTTNWGALRWTIAIFGTVMFFVVVLVLWNGYRYTPPSDAPQSVRFNEMVKAAVDIRLDWSRAMFQIMLVTAAAQLGLLIARPGEARLLVADLPEFIMLAMSGMFLFGSLICHYVYTSEVGVLYFSAGAASFYDKDNARMGDPLSWSVEYLLAGQALFLGGAMLLAVLVLFSAHRLKD